MQEQRDMVFQALKELNIDYKVIFHEAVYTIDEMKKLKLPEEGGVAKNLFLRDNKKRNYYVIVVDQAERVDIKQLSEKLCSRPLGFASEKDLYDILGLTKGAVTPLGILNDRERRVKVYLDKRFEGGIIAVHPNDNTATVWLKTSDLIRVIEQHGNFADFISFV